MTRTNETIIYVVHRIESGIAILEASPSSAAEPGTDKSTAGFRSGSRLGPQERHEVPAAQLPKGIREGDCLSFRMAFLRRRQRNSGRGARASETSWNRLRASKD